MGIQQSAIQRRPALVELTFLRGREDSAEGVPVVGGCTSRARRGRLRKTREK